MYISSIPNRKSPPAVLLRESFRENGKVKNRTLGNLSHWNPARIEALRRALRGDFDHVEPCEAALGPIFGMLYVLKQIADALGISGVFGNSRLAKLSLFLILARVAHQGSRLSAVRWAADHAVTALTDPQIRSLLGRKILQLELFSEQICEVEGAGTAVPFYRHSRSESVSRLCQTSRRSTAPPWVGGGSHKCFYFFAGWM
jgi:hypothetical protein